ncbi:MAG: PAS domain S-box protein [Deltaproteobacteria bacterium]|nr:PAS domain S-box protein [Deltaproteobacteria bacterium]
MQNREIAPGKPGTAQEKKEYLQPDIPLPLNGSKRVETAITTLYDISRAISSTKNLDELFVSIHKSLSKIIDVMDFTIALYDKKKDIITFPYRIDRDNPIPIPIENVSVSETITARVVRTRQTLFLKESDLLRVFRSHRQPYVHVPAKVWIGIPLLIKDDVLGAISVKNRYDPNAYQQEDVDFLESVSDQIAIAIDRKRTEDALKKAYDEMEENVRLRTIELEEVNARLRAEIQERERAQEVLRMSEEKFSKAFHASPSLMCIARLQDGRFIDVNETFLRVHGFRREEVIGHTSAELGMVPVENRERVAEMLRKGPVHNLEIRLHNKAGQLVYGSFSADIIIIEGQPHMLAVVDDITVRKQAEDALKESEEKYRAIFENAPVGITLSSKDGRLLAANQAFLDMIGYSSGEMRKKPLSSLYVDPEARKSLLKQVDQRDVAVNFPARIRRKDKTIVDTLLTTTKVHQSSGEEALQSICVDVSEIERNRKELDKYQRHLEKMVEERTSEIQSLQEELLKKERLAVMGRLTATVAHEIRNPLGTINTSIFSIKAATAKNEPERIKRSLMLAERNVKRCDDIITELLDYTRDVRLTLEPVDMDAWIKEVLEEQTYPEGIRLIQNLCCGLTIPIDREYFRRTFINVFTNAVDALRAENLIVKELTVETALVDQNLEVRIMDTGMGIPEDIFEKIFEPLFSTKGFGVGLGLTIAKDIMEKHQGDLKIQSEVGKGTMVTLRLPLSAGSERHFQ